MFNYSISLPFLASAVNVLASPSGWGVLDSGAGAHLRFGDNPLTLSYNGSAVGSAPVYSVDFVRKDEPWLVDLYFTPFVKHGAPGPDDSVAVGYLPLDPGFNPYITRRGLIDVELQIRAAAFLRLSSEAAPIAPVRSANAAPNLHRLSPWDV